jgi:hypothetical protein
MEHDWVWFIVLPNELLYDVALDSTYGKKFHPRRSLPR